MQKKRFFPPLIFNFCEESFFSVLCVLCSLAVIEQKKGLMDAFAASMQEFQMGKFFLVQSRSLVDENPQKSDVLSIRSVQWPQFASGVAENLQYSNSTSTRSI